MHRVVLGWVVVSGCTYTLTSPDDSDTTPVIWSPPTANSWEQTPPPDGLVGNGFEVGDVAPDVRLADQYEDTVSLWQFYGKVIVLDISTSWCAPCQALAETCEETYLEYEPEGFMYVTVLQADLEFGDPDTDDLLLWAGEFGISTPVLDDGTDPQQTVDAIVPANTWPAVLVIDREMRVHERVDPPEDAGLRAAIESVL